jgi:hypothetical protein
LYATRIIGENHAEAGDGWLFGPRATMLARIARRPPPPVIAKWLQDGHLIKHFSLRGNCRH